jgi:hypothetical protein
MMTSGAEVGPAGEAYWIAAAAEGGVSEIKGIKVDSSGNVYVTGPQGTGGTQWVAKYNSSGVLQWQRGFYSTGFSSSADGLAIDNGNNVYIVGSLLGSSSAATVIKYDTDGTFQWQKGLGTSNNTYGTSIAIDSSNDVYITGSTNSQGAGSTDVLIVKYNSSGTLQWQRALGDTNFNTGSGIALDNSGNVCVVGYTNTSGTVTGVIAKYNSSGTVDWQRSFDITPGTDQLSDIAIDSSGNIYIVGDLIVSKLVFAKYNSSGTLQWQFTIEKTSTSFGKSKICLDGSTNIYITGSFYLTFPPQSFISKFNSSGTLQWARTFGNNTTTLKNLPAYAQCVTTNSAGIVYVGGSLTFGDPGDDAEYPVGYIAKLPTDGSLTGTYTWTGTPGDPINTDATYASVTVTISTPSVTSSTLSLTSTTTTLPANTTSYTSYTPTVFSSTVNL